MKKEDKLLTREEMIQYLRSFNLTITSTLGNPNILGVYISNGEPGGLKLGNVTKEVWEEVERGNWDAQG